MDSLRAMFPDTDPATLQAALTAHGNSVERTVDYLLNSRNPTNTPNPTSNQARQLQEEQDAALARRLAAEQELSYRDTTHAPFSASSAETNPANQPFSLPTLGDVQNAVKPIIDGVQYAGRMAVEGVNSLCREFMAGDEPRGVASGGGRRREDVDDEARVLRGEAASPGGSGGARMRRGYMSGGASTVGGKKDA